MVTANFNCSDLPHLTHDSAARQLIKIAFDYLQTHGKHACLITRVKSTADVQSLFTDPIQKGREKNMIVIVGKRGRVRESDKFVIESAENIDPHPQIDPHGAGEGGYASTYRDSGTM